MKTPPVMCACFATLPLITLLVTLHVLTAVPVRTASHTRFPRKFWNLDAVHGITRETTLRPPVGVKDTVRERRLVWRDLEHKEPQLSNSHSQTLVPEWSRSGRRHALFTSQGNVHAQLMRAGCVLGTCQVQNLTHRLHQLIGQRRREHSSPVNPRSPHSYG